MSEGLRIGNSLKSTLESSSARPKRQGKTGFEHECKSLRQQQSYSVHQLYKGDKEHLCQ